MNEDIKDIEIIKKAGDTVILDDYRKHMQKLIDADDKEDMLFFEVIQQSDRNELDIIERVLLKTFDYVRETMVTSDFYGKKDLARINFLLQSVKLKIECNSSDSVDLNPVLDGFGLGRVNI